VRVESLDDVFRVVDAAGEDDGLAEGLAAVDLDAVLHQEVEGLVDGVLIEQPAVERGGVDLARHLAVAVG
jgi:hypothetical protein